MSELRFEWDQRKAAANKAKHGVTFEAAATATAFADEFALFMSDPDHSGAEDRFVLLGLRASARILVVVHTHREDNDVLRIISARRANTRERRQYKEANSP